MPRKPVVRITGALARTATRHRMPLTAAQIRVLAGATADELSKPRPGAGADGRVLPGAFLTADQLEVLKLAANGSCTEQIASATGRTVHTVKSQVRLILQRLGAVDRTQAVAVAMARGLLDPADIRLPEGMPRRKSGRKPRQDRRTA
ncbi:helix-turn-helix transcriptional regulator [Streptomyces sp. NPDC051173]|uniref:response regulator transcription factor n=1 Tax=Streptomyces sp. NPDC051173 TaxID=3155164 RepID=UPI00344FC9E0